MGLGCGHTPLLLYGSRRYSMLTHFRIKTKSSKRKSKNNTQASVKISFNKFKPKINL